MLAIGRRWFLLLIAGVLVAAAGAYAITSIQQKTFEAKATLIVGQSLTSASPDYTQLLTSQELSATYAAVATTRPILEAVHQPARARHDPGRAAARVGAAAPAGSTLLTISAQDNDPKPGGSHRERDRPAAGGRLDGHPGPAKRTSRHPIDADLAATQAQIVTTQGRITQLSGQATRTAAEDTELATLESRLVTLRSTYATLLGLLVRERDQPDQHRRSRGGAV